MNKWVLILTLGLFFFEFVNGMVVDTSIYEQFNNGNEKVRVIVTKKDTDFWNQFNTMFENNIEKVVEREGRYVVYVSRKELDFLAYNNKIEKIVRDIPLKAFLQDVVGQTSANLTWRLQRNGINLTGSLSSVCILDSGINNSHPDFSGKVLAEKCYCSASDSGAGGCCPDNTTEDNSAIDDYGHGTHVAGIVGASGGINGVATGVGLVVVKIMNATGVGYGVDLDDGIQWCVDNAETYNISVITASLGDRTTKHKNSCDDVSTSTTNKINSAFAKNISVVISSGNNGWIDGITWPSCITNATPVGSVNKSDSLYYNRNSLLKLLGVGVDVNSTCLVGNTGYINGYCTRSGTSMSAPGVAGVIAILNQYLNLTGRIWTPLQIENILYDNGKIINESGNNYSRINSYSALLSLDVDAPNVTLVSPENYSIDANVNQTFVCNATDWQLANVTLNVWNSSGGLYYNATNNFSGSANSTNFSVNNISFGSYEWNCLVSDEIGNSAFASVNFSLIIGGVSTELVSPSDNSYSNVAENNFSCRVVSESNYSLSNVTLKIWNSSGLVYNFSKNISGVGNTSVFNYSFVDDGNYFWNCLGVNNVSNFSWGNSNYSFIFDSVAPNLTLTDIPGSATSNSISRYFGFNVSDENLANCSLIINGNITLTNSSMNTSLGQSFSRTFMPESWTWKINCSDFAGNVNSSDENSFVISAPVTSSGSSGGGGGGSSTILSVPQTYNADVQKISSGYTKKLKKDDVVNFSIFDFEGGRHLLSVNEVGLDFVELTIKSEPINLKLGVGQSAKLNLSSPVYYDLLVKLNAIIDNEVELTIQLINEPVEVEVVEVINESVVEKEVEVEVSGNWFFVVSVLVVVLVLIVFVVFKLNWKKLKSLKGKKKK